MYKPQLKRSSHDYHAHSTEYSQKNANQNTPKISFTQDKQVSLVPQAFFQQCKNQFFKRNTNGLTGVITTCQYNYPKMVEDEITYENSGHFQFNQQIFCFYKQKNIYLWQYDNNNFNHPRKFLKHTCEQSVTAIYFRQIIHSDFGNNKIMLVIIAFGQFAKFYRLQNFEVQNNNCLPFLQDLMITLYCPEIITNIELIYEQFTDEDPQKNSLVIILGDANGNLTLFDFNTKRKFIVDTIKQKLKRTIQKQLYSQIIQILPYKQFIFCLVKRHYQENTTWKFLQKLLKSQKANITVQQRIEVYRIQLNTSYNNFQNQLFTNSKITAFKKHCQFSTAQIVSKIKNSFTKHFQYNQNDDRNNEFQYIESISLKDNFVQIMFKSGRSILVDQDISFAQPPRPCIRKPKNINLYGKNTFHTQDQTFQQRVLIKSIGTQLMLFQGFIASMNHDCSYFTPFSMKQSEVYTRSIKRYKKTKKNQFVNQNNEFIIFGHKSMTLAQRLSPKLTLFLYCAGMNEEYPHKKYIPQIKLFQRRIQRYIDFLGDTQLIIIVLQLLMAIKFQDGFSISLRMDLFQLLAKQLSSEQQITFRQAYAAFQQNQKTIVKNAKITFNKQIQQMLWKIILKVDKTKTRLSRNNEWGLNAIQSVCLAFQVMISECYKQIRDWTARNFCYHRDTIYKIISYSKILKQLINNYLNRQARKHQKKMNQSNQTDLKALYNSQFILNSKGHQSLKVKFCQMSKITLQKLILLLKVYDYICEMDMHGTQIPRFSDLIFNFNQTSKIRFANTILKSIGVNNEALIDNLITNIPELELQQTRRFNLWQSLHIKSGQKYQDTNKTLDSSYEGDAQQLNQLLSMYSYRQIQQYYLRNIPNPYENKGILDFKAFNTEKNEYLLQKENMQHFINGVTLLLKACLKKILDIRAKQIQLSNIISVYKNSSDDYFGVLQLPSLQKKLNQLLKQIDFFTRCCEQLLEKIFQKYQKNIIPKQMIAPILESIKSNLTIEVRRKIQLCLQKYKLTDLIQSISRRQLFTSTKSSNQSSVPSNFMAAQISLDVMRKYK